MDILGLTDTIREGTQDVIRSLTALTSTSPVLLTGDNQRGANQQASTVGISEIRADLLREDKVNERRRQADGHCVLFVGDGINDAPAMAAAHASIAMGVNGADLTLDTADPVTVSRRTPHHPRCRRAGTPSTPRRHRQPSHRSDLHHRSRRMGLNRTPALPLGVVGHKGSTIIFALNGLRLLSARAWRSDPPTPS